MRILDGWDPATRYGVPYMWGSVGFTYNVDMVKERTPGRRPASLDGPDLQARECREAGRLRDLDPRQPARHHADGAAIPRASTATPPTWRTTRRWSRRSARSARIIAHLRQYQLPQRHPERRALRRSTAGRATTPSPRPAPKRPGIDDEPGLFRAEDRRAGLGRRDVRSRRTRRTGTTPIRFLDFLLQPEVIAGCTNYTWLCQCQPRRRSHSSTRRSSPTRRSIPMTRRSSGMWTPQALQRGAGPRDRRAPGPRSRRADGRGRATCTRPMPDPRRQTPRRRAGHGPFRPDRRRHQALRHLHGRRRRDASTSPRARSSRCSAARVAARPRSCGCSPGSRSRARAASSSTART